MLLASVNTAWAQTTVATIGSTPYPSLQAAVNAVQNGQKIDLVNNSVTDSKVTMKAGNYTIDFHDHGIFNANVSNTAEEYEKRMIPIRNQKMQEQLNALQAAPNSSMPASPAPAPTPPTQPSTTTSTPPAQPPAPPALQPAASPMSIPTQPAASPMSTPTQPLT